MLHAAFAGNFMRYSYLDSKPRSFNLINYLPWAALGELLKLRAANAIEDRLLGTHANPQLCICSWQLSLHRSLRSAAICLAASTNFFDSTVAEMKVGGEKFAIDLHRTIICVRWNQSWYGLKPSDKMINKIRLPVS